MNEPFLSVRNPENFDESLKGIIETVTPVIAFWLAESRTEPITMPECF
jgi:hypothetical protein